MDHRVLMFLCIWVFYRKLEEQQNDLLSYSQQIAKLNETLEETQRAKDREREGIVHKFEEQMKSLQSQLEDMVRKIILILIIQVLDIHNCASAFFLPCSLSFSACLSFSLISSSVVWHSVLNFYIILNVFFSL